MITHIKDPNSDKCIVFIHGLGGGPNTFSKFIVYLELKWNLSYGVLLYIFGYYKKIFYYKAPSWIPRWVINMFGNLTYLLKAFWSKRNSHNVELLGDYIKNNCNNSNNIILVAHSMGGLIARQYLVNCKKNKIDIRKIRLLCTFATPHNGSHIAKNISFLSYTPILKKGYTYFSNLFRYRLSPQIGDLSDLNIFITKLNNDWRDLNVDSDLQFIRIGGTKDWLVRTNSSNLHSDDLDKVFYFPYNHSGIIYPSIKDSVFGPIDKFLEKLRFIEDKEEYFEELEDEIDYDGSDDNF